MKHFALALILVAGCKKPATDTPTAGSSAGSATVVVAAPADSATGSDASAALGSAGSADAPFDDKLDMPTQPKRSVADAKLFAAAEAALRITLKTGKTATSGTTLCPAFGPLDKAMTALSGTYAPTAADGYAELRAMLLQTFDGINNFCASPGQDPKDAPLDELQGFLGNIRSRFTELAHLGAK